MIQTFLRACARPFPFLRTWAAAYFRWHTLREWQRDGRPVPPPHAFKVDTLIAYGREYGLQNLIETGTCQGDTVNVVRHHFSQVYSIELSPELHAAAMRRFAAAGNVSLILGDSSVELRRLTDRLQEPALFWLDGHYSAGVTAKGSKETPILDELATLFDRSAFSDVIIIDDARCFGRDPDYPSLAELEAFVRSRRPDLRMTVADDLIRLVRPS